MSNEEIVAKIKAGHRELQTQLYEQNQGIIFQYARKYAYGDREDELDLRQELALQLFQCADKYEKGRGANFLTYSIPWLQQCCVRFNEKNRLVYLPSYIQEQLRKLQKLRGQGLSEEDCRQAMYLTEQRFGELKELEIEYQGCVSLSTPLTDDGESEITLGDAIPDERNQFLEIEAALENAATRRIVNALGEPFRTILWLKYENELTHKQIGEKLGLSPYDVRRFLHKGYKLLQDEIRKTEFIEREAFCSSRVKKYLAGNRTSSVEAALGL